MSCATRPGLAWTIGPLLVLWALTARGAAPSADERAAAIALFEEGRQLMADGAYEDACPKLAESLRLAPGVGTRFNLAECQEKIGQLASAWANYLEVAARTEQLGQPARERAARRRAAALQPKLATLRIEVIDPVEGLSITRDGRPVPQAQWNVALPVDPATYRIRAASFGHEPATYLADVSEPGEKVRVVIRPLERKSGASEGSGAEERGGGGEEAGGEAAPPAGTGDGGRAQTIAGWTVAGVGLAHAAVGLVLYGVGRSFTAEAEAQCTLDDAAGAWDCSMASDPNDIASRGETGRDLALMGIVTVPFGCAGVLAGIIAVATAPDDDEVAHRTGPRVSVTPAVGPDGMSLSVGAVW